MTQPLTHWKKLTNPDFIGAYDFQPNEERWLTIDHIERKQIVGGDGKKEEATIAFFRERSKPMILNVTNAKMIAKLAESPYVENWSGVPIKVFATRVKFGREMVDALRIKDEKPVQRKVLQLGTEDFAKCRSAFLQGYSVETIGQKWIISEEVEKELTKKEEQ